MMRFVLSLALLLAVQTSAQPVDICKTAYGPYLPQCKKTAPLLSFADSSGVGMGTACACTSVTGTKGEALTFTRAGAAWCSVKGVANTGIATGDLVLCPLNAPRIAPGANGYPGLLKEHSHTNVLIQTQAFNNAAWTSTATIIAAPTVTADAVNGPCGVPNGTTCFAAERFQTASCGATPSCNSLLFQGTGLVSSPAAGSIFVKGNGTSGTLALFFDSTSSCIPCPYVSATWTRCEGFGTPTGGNFAVGTDNSSTGCGDGQAADVFLWGAQAESVVGVVGARPSSYITTTTAAATRAADLSQFLGVTFPTNNTGSFAASIIANSNLSDAEHGIVSQSSAGPAYGQLLDYVGGTPTLNVYFSAGAATNVGSIVIPFTAARVAGFWDHATQAVSIFNGVQGPVPLATPPITTTNAVEIGQYSGVAQLDGIINQVCVDSDPTRCR